MMRMSFEVRKMRRVVPALNLSHIEFLIGIMKVTGNGSQSDLQFGPRCELAAELEEKIISVDGIVIEDVDGDHLCRGAQDSFKLW